MTDHDPSQSNARSDARVKAATGVTRKGSKPAWGQGLRKLYDDVAAEPLPPSFEDLLDRLEQARRG